ncbi:MAG: 1-deoxy-D-xylulose-5-phosphate synthase [Bacteroidales bacterium]|nr:1-deoxy-D-xylulose-5-phosphate synthase [Bacteroidales bacterium]
MYELLDKIDSPADIKGLDIEELGRLCAEIREFIIECCAVTPGHVASSLGAVELIVAWHYVFDSPEDRLVFDVGHQAYAHKIITGRRELFRKNRSKDGLSGFPTPHESPHDAYVAGHSSNSVSAALGLAEAARIQCRRGKVCALIGDGALTGGLAFEGLNNAGSSKADLLVILNDNNQSIDGNLGALHNYLLKVTTSSRYNNLKDKVWNKLGNSRLRAAVQRRIRSIKSFFVKQTGGDLFEALGFRYFGPVDGNDIKELVGILTKLRSIRGPRVLHCCTVKGKGYAPSEKDPVVWHAPGKFDPVSGERSTGHGGAARYQDVFGEVLCELAEADPRVVGITPAMASGCGMTEFARRFPERFFDVGIEEEHAVTFSGGLAAGGLRPFCNIYSSFSQRAYDQIIHDAALPGLPVILCFDRAGLVGEDGATHQGAFDMAAYRSIPGMVISAPADETELRRLMFTALHYGKGPFIIRYPRGNGEGTDWRGAAPEQLPVGKAETVMEGSEVAVIACGPAVHRAAEAAAGFRGKVGVYNFRFIKPLDEETLRMIAERYKYIVTAEDGCIKGGLFGAVSEYLAPHAPHVPVIPIGIPDRFMRQDSVESQRRECELDAGSMEKILQKFLEI